jgi:hypothetical protein
VALRTKTGETDILGDFVLQENPFRGSAIYNVDEPERVYVRAMYGKQLDEFYRKFFILPLTKDSNKQAIGAVWSSHAGDAWGKGFGKSMLMAEESRCINADFGAEMLRTMEAEDEDIDTNPVLAGYCTFDESKEVKSFPAALLDAVVFILDSPHGDTTVHAELRRRILERVEHEPGYESEAIQRALLADLKKYKGLNVQLGHRALTGFMERLAHHDTQDLLNYVRHEGIGPRIKAAQGLTYVHVFNAFVSLAGIVYVAYFIDQIENFAKWQKKNQDRSIKVLREAMCQTSPTAQMASFVFQMHIAAQRAIEDWWNSEHLPSLDYNKAVNSTRVVDLKGLTTCEEAADLAVAYLEKKRPPGKTPPAPLHPFSDEIIEAVRVSVGGNPRKFLERLGDVVEHAVTKKEKRIDLSFIQSLLGDDDANVGGTAGMEDEDDFENPER